MILAAGRGERMRPLTDHTPKPLLKAGGRPLIEHLISGLVAGGITEIIVNTAHLGEQVEAALGDGSHLALGFAFHGKARHWKRVAAFTGRCRYWARNLSW